MLRSSVSLALLALLAVTALNVHAGSNSDANEGCRSGSPGSGSSEGNDQMAVSQSSAGGSSGSSSQRGASGSVNSGSYKPRIVNGTAVHRFDRAGLALSAGEPTFTLPESDNISVYILKNTVDSEAAFHRLVFRMNKLVDYFVYQTQGLPSHFKEVVYNDPRGYDMVIMHVDSLELAGKATPQLKRKVAAWLKTKLTPVVAN